MFSEILESSTGRSVIGMSLLFAWVYISDYFEVIPFVAMTVQVLVGLFFCCDVVVSLSETIINNREHSECIYGQRWVHLHCLNQRKLKKDRTHRISKDWNPWTDRLCPRFRATLYMLSYFGLLGVLVVERICQP